jgi:glyoxylase-like metal-dependent hydrolase (beta-lactamase superfamily II)
VIRPLAAGLDYVDLQFLGHAEIIATAVIHGPGGVALVDPGPSTSLDTLKRTLAQRGLGVPDIRYLLLTHIHLDHAGATGSLVRENPAIEVYVHELGAPHMANPVKLLGSATRLYGSDMERLWGEFLPVPEKNLRPLTGGETIRVAARELQVAYTPGHASHHVSYFDPSSRIAFVGDTGGIRRGRSSYVMPPAPPPDVDLEAWRESEAKILLWDPETLFLTHFGPFGSPRLQFQQLRENLETWSRIVRRLLADASLDDASREQHFVDEAYRHLQRVVGPGEAESYGRAGRLDYSWQGLSRYWRKQSPRP